MSRQQDRLNTSLQATLMLLLTPTHPFPGKERHLLRAQIARISFANTISPKGFIEVDDETGLEKFAEEFTMPSTDELKSLESWGHSYP